MNPKLSIVIHTEEEFDWHGGFFRSNNHVTHGQKLIAFCEELISLGVKITFALDFAFVDSNEGQTVINHFRARYPNDIEFASHLHPWLNPPIKNGEDEELNSNSYPGNLSRELEFEKLKTLTNKITEVCGSSPVTYLAGRYGVGKNTLQILKSLGYTTDISISPFSDFSRQEGPSFQHFNNNIFIKDDIIHWPHTTAITALFPFIERWFDKKPHMYQVCKSNKLTRLILKALRIKQQRLSPEGFTLNDLKTITNTQLKLGQNKLIFSFHSPSVQTGLTPYVKTVGEEEMFLKITKDYISWFISEKSGTSILIKDFNQEQ